MTETEKLYYIDSNAFVPEGVVTSTARRGDKWFNTVKVGDLLNLSITETDESFGAAIVVAKELVPYEDVIAEADHNHCALNPKWANTDAETALRFELFSAYGPGLKPDEEFTVLHLVRITGAKVSNKSQFVEAYKAIESENRYQIAKLGEEGQDQTISEWAGYIHVYANEALSQAAHGNEDDALDSIRKVATMGVVALQTFGSPHREGY